MNTISKKKTRISLSDMEFLSHLNISLSTNHNYQSNIEEALSMIGRRFQFDRIHIIKIFPDNSFIILHEWCAHCIPSMKKQVKKSPCFFDPTLQQQLNEKAYILIDNPDQLSNPKLRLFYKKYATINTLFLPLLLRNFFAFLSFSHCRTKKCWSEEEIHFMNLLSSIIAANLEKNLLIARLMHKIKN